MNHYAKAKNVPLRSTKMSNLEQQPYKLLILRYNDEADVISVIARREVQTRVLRAVAQCREPTLYLYLRCDESEFNTHPDYTGVGYVDFRVRDLGVD